MSGPSFFGRIPELPVNHLRRLMSRALRPFVFSALMTALHAVWAEPSTGGQTGLINLPSARIEPDGIYTIGYSFARPYASFYNNLTALPFLELTLSAFRIMYTPGIPGSNYGDYKDKRLDVKFRLIEEGEWLPQVAVGSQDAVGTRLFGAEYIVASKRFGENLDLTLGYGLKTLSPLGASNVGAIAKRNRLAGIFGGARLKLSTSLSLVAERDAINYSLDPRAATSRADKFRGNTAVGIEYRWGWLGIQASRQGKEFGVNTFVRIPLNQREFVPKINEPEPYAHLTARPTISQWRNDPVWARRMRRTMEAEEFGGVKIALDDGAVLRVSVGHPRISHMARAVGRAARIALLLSPTETREIRVTYLEGALPFATYTFFDLDRLRRYFNGQIPRSALAETVAIDYADLSARGHAAKDDSLGGFDDERERPVAMTSLSEDESGHLMAFRRRDKDLGSFELVPLKVGAILESASGFFQYQIYSELNWSKRLGDGLFLDAALNLRLYDSFDPSLQTADPAHESRLPHVSSDLPLYVRGSRLRLDRLSVSQYFQLRPRLYGRASAGVFGMMFSGIGGQLLYLPEQGSWAVDIDLNAVRQRAHSGWLKHQSYSTVTAIGSLHYRMPMGVKLTARIGRFLARDKGVRFEASRRFNSGLELGGWLAVTDNQDLTAPGSEGKPYRDKGVFVKIPFDAMLFKDTRSSGGMSLAEWNRDVGRMVDRPGDLYDMLEKPVLDMQERDGLSRFGDVDDDYDLPALGTGRGLFERPILNVARNDVSNLGDWITSLPTWGKIGLGLGAVAASSVLDNRGLRFANDYGDKRLTRYARNVGNLLPFAAGGAALALAVDGRDRGLSDAGYAAVQAGAFGLLASEGLKYAIHRARPSEGKGSHSFAAASAGDSSLPSNTTALMWAVTTPFAKEYDAPWLYGVAALTNLARVSGKKHWVSDTIAGSLLGYGLGSFFWESRRRDTSGGPDVAVTPGHITASWEFQ